MAASEDFRYGERLQAGEFRILTVSPGTFDSPIFGTLRTELFDASPDYHALSYCWGDPTKAEQIWIDGKCCAVTQSVYEALQYLRSSDTILCIWIDAVCINQDDLEEKNVQVQRMGMIYERAETTRVWLGPPAPGRENALEAVAQSLSIKQPSLNDIENYRDAIAEVMIRPWHSRLWALQEAALACQCSVHYGNESCDLDSITTLSTNITNLELRDMYALLRAKGAQTGSDMRRALGSALWHTSILQKLRARLASRANVPFLSLLLDCASRPCTEPVDHVYALRALHQRLNGGIAIPPEVDYSLSVAEVFTRVTTEVLLLPNGVDDWTSALWSQTRGSGTVRTGRWHHELPSWVPDFTAINNGSGVAQIYRAGGPFSLQITRPAFSVECRGLTLKGVSACLIGRVHGYPNRKLTDKEWDALEHSTLHEPQPVSPYGETRLQAFGRTLILDQSCGTSSSKWTRWLQADHLLLHKPWRSWDVFRHGVESTPRDGNPTGRNTSTWRQYWETFQLHMRLVRDIGATFAVTASGHFALGCSHMSQEMKL